MERKTTVYIEDLELSQRTKNALQREKIYTLNALEMMDNDTIYSMRGLSLDGLSEIGAILSQKESIFASFEARQKKIDSIDSNIANMPVEKLNLSTRSFNAIKRAHIDTVGQFLHLDSYHLIHMRNVGIQSREEIQKKIDEIIGNKEGSSLADNENQSAITDADKKAQVKKDIDLDQEILAETLNLGTRTLNALKRANINSVDDLLSLDTSKLLEMRSVGAQTAEEIQKKKNDIIDNSDALKTLNTPEESPKEQETDEMQTINLDREILDAPIEKLYLGVQATRALKTRKLKTVEDLLKLNKYKIYEIRDQKTRLILLNFIDALLGGGASTSQAFAELRDTDDIIDEGIGFDYSVISILCLMFSFKPGQMAKWFGVSRQSIYNTLDSHNMSRNDVWTGKILTDREKIILHELIASKKFDYKDNSVICYCLNNRKNDFACIFIYKDEIKCWFLKDLPDDLAQEIIAANLHKYSESELAGESDGEVVYCIRKPYFLPEDPKRFRRNAELRNMTTDEYSQFLYRCPIGNAKQVRDEAIISWLEENMVDGKVYLSSDPKNQWIRSLASRNGYSLKDFIALYGYESTRADIELSSEAAREKHISELQKVAFDGNQVFLAAGSPLYRALYTYSFGKNMTLTDYISSLGFKRVAVRPNTHYDVLEHDMQVHPDGDCFEDKLFARYPLLGSALLSPETTAKLNDNARKYIDAVLKNQQTRLTSRAEMQITIALINCAKNWKIEENSNFWSYIMLQFGYRGNNKIIEIIQNSLEHAMKLNQRLFVEDINGRAFKSTVVIHALTTRKSWMVLFDFLFDFYKNNLNWKIVPGDPLLDTMVRELQKKLAGEGEDVSLTISSKVYSFQEGIRKLVLLRPAYTRSLFEKLIIRIDSLINSEVSQAKTYEEQLCDDWFKEKIASIANTKRSERSESSAQREVVIDYAKIRPKFILRKETQIQIVLPDIRLLQEDFKRTTLSVYTNNQLVTQTTMSWYGNELGKTLNGINIPMPEVPAGSEGFQVRITIACDDDIIYDSENDLNRQALMFFGTNETSFGSIKKENYTIVLPQEAELRTENVDITDIDSFGVNGLKAFFLELRPGYVLTVNGKLLAFDNENQTDLHVISPAETDQLPKVAIEENEFSLAYDYSCCTIILSKGDYWQQFVILKDGNRLSFSELPVSDDGLVFSLPLFGKSGQTHIQIINLEDEKLLYDKRFILIKSGNASFNREFYYDEEDYKDAQYAVQLDDYEETTTFEIYDDEIRIPFRDGMLHTAIPKIKVEETTGKWMNGDGLAWHINDIPQESFLRVEIPDGVQLQFHVNDLDIQSSGKGYVAIGNVLQSIGDAQDKKKIALEMKALGKQQRKSYRIAQIFFKEGFIRTPKFWTEGVKLFWDHGEGYVGKTGRDFTLTIVDEEGKESAYSLDEQTEFVVLPDNMPIGNYHYEISILSGSLFKKTKEVIAQGECIIGDANLLRFKERRIVIDAVTDSGNENAGHVRIRRCYIDHLTFLGVEETSEGLCPVYEGILYTLGSNGERFEYSSAEFINKRGIKKLIVNPVRVVYIGETTLCITDPEGDGLYYYHYYDKIADRTIYSITDREYTKENKRAYSTADLYIYRMERTT